MVSAQSASSLLTNSQSGDSEIAASTGKTAIADALTGDAVAVVVAVLQARAGLNNSDAVSAGSPAINTNPEGTLERVGNGKSGVLTNALIGVVVVDASGLAVLLNVDVAIVSGAFLRNDNRDGASSESLEGVVVPSIISDKTTLRSAQNQRVSLGLAVIAQVASIALAGVGVGTTDAVTVVRATRRAFGVRSSGLDGKAASRETIDTNVPVATIRIGDRDGGISGEGRVQVIPVEEVGSTITTDIKIAVASGGSLVHENSQLVVLLGQVELVVSPVTSGESALLLLAEFQIFLAVLASFTKVTAVASASAVEAVTVAVAVLRACSSDYSLELISALSEAEHACPPGTTASIVDVQGNIRSEGDIALVVVVGCGCSAVSEIQIAVTSADRLHVHAHRVSALRRNSEGIELPLEGTNVVIDNLARGHGSHLN